MSESILWSFTMLQRRIWVMSLPSFPSENVPYVDRCLISLELLSYLKSFHLSWQCLLWILQTWQSTDGYNWLPSFDFVFVFCLEVFWRHDAIVVHIVKYLFWSLDHKVMSWAVSCNHNKIIHIAPPPAQLERSGAVQKWRIRIRWCLCASALLLLKQNIEIFF